MTNAPTCTQITGWDLPDTGYELHRPRHCGQPAALRTPHGSLLCPQHAEVLEGHHLLSDGDLLSIVGESVAAAENECRTGHAWKQDEVALGVWRAVLRALGREEPLPGYRLAGPDEIVLPVALCGPPCPYDPAALVGVPLGMFHCPECGEMVVAGQPHPEYRWDRMVDLAAFAKAERDRLAALLAETAQLLTEARFHVTTERDEHSIRDCSHCSLDERIEELFVRLDAAAREGQS